MNSLALAVLAASLLVSGCASRKLHSCAASIFVFGPAEFWLECPPPPDTLSPQP